MVTTGVIAMTAASRPDYLRTVLESWAGVERLEDYRFLIQCEPLHDSVIDLARHAPFPTDVEVNPERYGPLHNPWVAIERGFSTGAKFVIVAEDDSIVAPDVLRFMRFCFRTYGRRPDVLAWCAFQKWPLDEGCPNGVQLRRRFAPTIWGVSRWHWETRLRETWDHDYTTGDGHHSGWDWNINLRLLGSEESCAFPSVSRSQHIGQYGGSHCTSDQFHELQARVFAGDMKLPRRRFEEI